MSFKHKLSKRLAISWRRALGLVPFAVLSACRVSNQALTEPTESILVISPGQIGTDYQQTVQFQAFLRGPAGDSALATVQWGATGGAITEQGVFTADTLPGEFTITAQDGAGRTATAKVGVGYSGPTLVSTSAARPAKVTDLAVAGVTQDAITLRFTEVDDGAGQPAQYHIRLAQGSSIGWGSATPVTDGTCASPTAGTAIGATRLCSVTGLKVATKYAFRLVAFRGTLDVNAVLSSLSNVASGTTAAATPAPVASVTVSPASASLLVGATQQLTAALRDANENVLTGQTVSWTSSAPAVATVSTSGLISGVAAGTATITATSEGQSGSAAITVTGTSGGGTVLFQESFEDNAFASRGWYDNTGMTTTTAQHVAGSTRALEARFPAGATTPTWGGAARRLFQATPTLYVSYWVKYSSNWVGSGRPYHPHEFLVMSDQDGEWDGPSNGWLVSYIEHNYQNGGIPRLALQDNKAINTSYGSLPNNLINLTENRSTSGCNGVVESNVVTTCFNMPPWYNGKEIHAARVAFQPTAGPGYKGDWNHVEVYFQLNSVAGGIGLPDGVMQYWFNGTPVIDRHDVLYRAGARPTIQFRQFVIAPYIGDGSPVDQTMWVDDLTVATGKP